MSAKERHGQGNTRSDAAFAAVPPCPFISMTTLYHTPGTADAVAAALPPTAAALFRGQIDYYRGEIKKVYIGSRRLLTEKGDFNADIGVGMLLSLVAMVRGDRRLWQEAREHIAAVPCHDENEREQLRFWLAATDSALYDATGFPIWFQQGSFDFLPRAAYPSAHFFYVKQILIYCHGAAFAKISAGSGLNVMRMVPAVAEPLIAQAQADGALLPEVYLHLLCAIGWHDCGDKDLAAEHVDRAIELVLPDDLLMPLAEHRRLLHFLLDDRLREKAPSALPKVRRLNKQLLHGWTKLHNAVTGRTVSNDLSVREHEVAKLAAFGLSNQEIADRLFVSVNTVKQVLFRAMEKTGAKSRNDLERHL